MVSLDPESQRNGKEKKISEMWQYSNIPYINDFFFFVLKLLHYLPKSSHFKKKTDLSTTAMIKKLLKQNFQAITVQWC